MTADMFAAPAAEIRRDRWGRPLIHPREGGTPIPYTRTSSLSSALTDQSALKSWYARNVARGLAARPDLLSAVAVAKDDAEVGRLAEQAADVAGGTAAATTGTTLHRVTELADLSEPLPPLPPQVAADLDAYQQATAALTVLDCERFVVCDELQAAGSLDRLVRLPDGRVVVADLKTGKAPQRYALGAAVQVATYAHSARYDPGTGERSPIHPDLDLTVGLLIALPQGSATCGLYLLDLAAGYAAAKHATTVRRIHSHKPWAVALETETATQPKGTPQ